LIPASADSRRVRPVRSGDLCPGDPNLRRESCRFGAKRSPNRFPKPSDLIRQAFQICASLPLPGLLALPAAFGPRPGAASPSTRESRPEETSKRCVVASSNGRRRLLRFCLFSFPPRAANFLFVRQNPGRQDRAGGTAGSVHLACCVAVPLCCLCILLVLCCCSSLLLASLACCLL